MLNIGNATDYITELSYSTWGLTIINDELFISNYITNAQSNCIYVYDIDTKELKRTIPFSTTFKLGLGTDGTELYINTTSGISRIDKQTGDIINTNTNIINNNTIASFKIDLSNDRIYYSNYAKILYIRKYSTGDLIASYTLPVSYTTGVELINNRYILVSCYQNNRIYISEINNNDITNLNFNLLYMSSTDKIAGIGYYNNNIYLTNYTTKLQIAEVLGLLRAKYLFVQDNKYYSIKDNQLIELTSPTTDEEKIALFNNNGVDILDDLTEEDWNNLFPDKSVLQILAYTESNIDTITIEYNVPEYRPIDKLENQFQIKKYIPGASIPDTPTNLTASDVSKDSSKISWT